MTEANEYTSKIDQHIKFVERIIQKPSISVSARQELSKQIKSVKKRRNDPNLYLAIIGEFSSGKSTFVNALLRDDLLKTSALVATATATKITYANSFGAEALFKTNRPRQFIKKPKGEPKKTTQKFQVAWFPSLFIWMFLMIGLSSISSWFLGLILLPVVILITTMISHSLKRQLNTPNAPSAPNRLVTSNDALKMGISPQKFVQMVTSEEELARALDDFTIYHPANFLKGRIIIIDTPGTNAGNEEHAKATRTVVENEADAAVIVIPANQPVSDTLINFLSGSLYQYIHRCVFIVTKMDSIRQKEQSRLIKIIEKRIRENLKIDNFLLLETAPQVVIDICTGAEEVEEKLRHWNDNFVELEEKLRKYLVGSREVAIAENLGRLLTKVFRQSESHLKEQQEQFRRKQEAIEREVIQDLPSFTSEQYAECSRIIQNATSQTKSKINKLVGNCRESTVSSLQQMIFNTTNKDELKIILENKIFPIFANARSTLDVDLTIATSELNQSFIQVKEHFDEKFSKQYQNLQSLSTETNLNTGIMNTSNIQVNTYNLMSSASELSKIAGDTSNIQVGAGAGVGAGAAIGTIILPGVGTVVGAALGSLLGGIFGSFFGPSLSELQNSSWNELQPKINDYFYSAEKAVEQSLESYSQQMINALNRHIDTYIATYQKIVNAMQHDQKEKKERLNRLQQDIQADLLEINTRIQSLEVFANSTLM
ncbi:dynamin family protein [Nostoc sp. CCY0012]|uniref:dynamin family protein n=1 Tax=Nostoc sp. CCY0012 TaxID=1056123 RepID=UPI0039C5C175